MSTPDPKAAARAARIEANLAAIERHLAECVDLSGRGRDAFLGPDFVNRYAALAALIQTGNAVEDLPDEFRAGHVDVRWRALMSTRDKIGHIHGDSVDWDALWNTVDRDVPLDLAAVRHIIAQRGGPDGQRRRHARTASEARAARPGPLT